MRFGETIVKQGDDQEAVYFIAEGQTKLTMNPILHSSHYPALLSKLGPTPTKNENEIDPFKPITVIQRRKLKRDQGFFASEQRYRETDICTVGPQGMIGDIEAILDLPTYTITAKCIQELKLYEIDKSSFIKIVVKKNPDTYEKLRRSVLEKIKFRNDITTHGIPLYNALLIFFTKVKAKDNRKNILKAYMNSKKRADPVRSEFFAEMSRGISRNRTRVRYGNTFG